MSKGSGRRPAEVDEEEIARRWAETFGPKPDNQDSEKESDDGR